MAEHENDRRDDRRREQADRDQLLQQPRHPRTALAGAFERDPHQPTAEPCAGEVARRPDDQTQRLRTEEQTSELQSLMRISSAVFCLKKNNRTKATPQTTSNT